MSRLVDIILALQQFDFEFVASFLCVTGAALSSVLVEFRGRRGALELFAQISWQAQYFGAWV